jgi:protein OS-9
MTRQQSSVLGDRKETYERMMLHDQEYLCSVPIVETPPRNETSEAEARVEEKKELARATDRGWELLKDLEGNCLFYIEGWWSYSFCYNSEVTQFHHLPPQSGRSAFPPQRDSTTPQFVLGRAKRHKQSKEGERGKGIEVHKSQKSAASPGTELQVKGDTRYLVQKMGDGTICDLTGKPRRIEVQYHCNPHVNDRIGQITEETTCSYKMVIFTPRLCNDVAFMPPKESKANVIACRQIIADDEVPIWQALQVVEAEVNMKIAEAKPSVINVGGVILGGHKYVSEEGENLQLPANWAGGSQGPVEDIIAQSKGKADNYKVHTISDDALRRLDIDPNDVEELKIQVQQMAGDNPWRLEVVEIPGEQRELRVIVGGDEDEDENTEEKDGDKDNGRQKAYYKDEL